MKAERLELLKSKLQNYITELSETNGTPGFYLNREQIVEACKLLRDDLGFVSCVDAVSVDRFRKQERFEMIYNLVSIENNERIFIKVKLDTKNPSMQSLSQVWTSANWYEREAFDLMGINFENHPDLRRMYMPEAFEYHPLRKDFPLMGIPDSIPLPNK